MPEQEVETSPSGELSLKLAQQEWTGNDAIRNSYFAGQQMVISRSESDPDVYELHYLELKVGGFEEMADAKFNAPEFARSVFHILGDFIEDS